MGTLQEKGYQAEEGGGEGPGWWLRKGMGGFKGKSERTD